MRREAAGTVIVAGFRENARWENDAMGRGRRKRMEAIAAKWEAEAAAAAEGPPRCAMCEHEYPETVLTEHHLVPKSRGGEETVPLCPACHKQVHATYTEKELEVVGGTLEDLLAAEKLQGFIRWIRKRRPSGRVAVKTSGEKGVRRV